MDRLQLKPWEGEAATRPTNDRWCSFFFFYNWGKRERNKYTSFRICEPHSLGAETNIKAAIGIWKRISFS
jgi:hypothetical protein